MKMFYGASGRTFASAKRLRGNMTEAENILWERLSKNQLNNCRFRRQHPVGNYIADFYCHKAKLIVEVDGGHHYKNEQAHYDAKRTEELNRLGIKVIRFSNGQVKNDIEKVLEEIKRYAPGSPEGDAPVPEGDVLASEGDGSLDDKTQS